MTRTNATIRRYAPNLAPALAGIAAGAVMGWVFARLHTPIPWMLGPLLTVATLRIAGVPLAALPGGRQAGQWIIGTSLALYFTPVVMREVAGLWPWLLAGALFAIGLGYLVALLLVRIARIDLTSAIFACVPGGAAEMAVLGARFGARVDQVAAGQSIRILVVVMLVPALYAWSGVHGADPYVPGASHFDAAGFLLLISATFAGGFIAQRLRVPNAFVLGSLAVAIPLTAMEINLSTVPTLVSNAAQLLIGCALGTRFEPDFMRAAPRFVTAMVTTCIAAIGVSAVFGWTLAWAAGLPPAALILGTAPGGVAEMCITAKVLQLGVPIVTAFHVARVVLLLLGTAPLFAMTRAWHRRRRARQG